MGDAKAKYSQYANIIDPILEKKTDTKITARATRAGDKIGLART